MQPPSTRLQSLLLSSPQSDAGSRLGEAPDVLSELLAKELIESTIFRPKNQDIIFGKEFIML